MPEPTAEERRMPFLSHLEELRWCLIRSFGAIFAAFLISLLFVRRILDLLEWPLRKAGLTVADAPVQLRTISVAESFTAILTVAGLTGVAVSLPYILFEIWRFVSPGLKSAERKAVWPLIVFGTLFFFAGAAFTHILVMPTALQYFLELNRDFGFVAEWRIMDYLKFTLTMLFVSGILAELPVATVVLARFGIVSAPFMIQYWRHAIVAMFVVAALVTPSTDALTMFLIAVPLLFLYGVSILLAKLFYVQRW